MRKKERNYYKNINFARKEVHIKKKGKTHIMNFFDKGKLILWISGSKRRSFSTQEVDRKMIFP